MAEFAGRLQEQFKRTSNNIFLYLAKLASGLVLGLTVSLIVQESLGYKEGEHLLTFFFVIFLMTGIFMKIAKTWGFMTLFIVDLVAVLLGMICELYIRVGPNL